MENKDLDKTEHKKEEKSLTLDKNNRVRILYEREKDSSVRSYNFPRPRNILETIAEERARLDNDSFKQDIELRKTTLGTLFKFLKIETGIIFIIIFLQGFNFCGFNLQEWSFRIFVGATITQITVMLLVAVQYLFPKK